ncbi:hypothetical protein AX16_000542 [Volvariella volvacea WC 439]|nr:hypothetical protein AX16_000542 [Volvariella volvacea WC 439]
MQFNLLPLSLLFFILILDLPTPSSANLIDRAHKVAIRHSHRFARDLRIAFSGLLIARDDSNYQQQHLSSGNKVVYCKTRPAGTSGDSGGSSGGGAEGSGGNVSTTVFTTVIQGTATRTITVANTGGPLPTNSVPTSSPWKLREAHEGQDFFNGWSFFTDSDPTHGTVQYVDEATARRNSMLEVNSAGNAVMRVDTTPRVSGNRQSVRITTFTTFNGPTIFILDAVHMPTGCGTWPAFWTNGPNWPNGGEIDIVEGVHDYTNNQATLHTSMGCRLPSSNSDELRMTGTVIHGTDCAVDTTDNQGCGIRARSSNSFGSGFNANGGGVYAMKWDETGIAVYFFPAGQVPVDIQTETPLPDTWGRPMARFPPDQCNPQQFFHDQHAIINTSLCGDWAGGVWNDAGIPGQEQSCAQRTGFSTCEEYVRNNGDAFRDAYWEIGSVKVYQLD